MSIILNISLSFTLHIQSVSKSTWLNRQIYPLSHQAIHLVQAIVTPLQDCCSIALQPKWLGGIPATCEGKQKRRQSGYSGLLTKNPCHTYWRTTIWTREAYELNYLADFVDLKPLTQKEQGTGLGRNCTLFDIARKWAYKAIREYRGSTFDSWLGAVLKECLSVNSAFLEPLPYSEIKATARSIAKYCWKKDAYCYQEFIDRQQRKSRLGASKGGVARSALYNEKREKAQKLRKKGIKNTEIAKLLDISARTLRNWFIQE